MHTSATGETHQPSDPDSAARPANKEGQHSFAVVEGTRLHWAELGASPDRTPVVLLHGLSDSHRTWRRIGTCLGSDRRILMPDLTGFWPSGWREARYRLEWHAHMMDRWLDAL